MSTWDERRERLRTYLVYGRSEVADIDLDRGARGVQRIPNASPPSLPVGDLNGDGSDELVFGEEVGSELVVIFGRRDRAPVREANPRAPGARGFAIDLGRWGREGTLLVSAAGDANGDGLDDLAVLVESDGDCGEGGCGGRSFVVFGRRQARDVVLVRGSRAGRREVRSLNGRRPAGYSIDAVTGYDNVGSGGDFDGDGRDDLLVAGWEYGQGTAVVYGTRATVRVPANPSRRAAATRILHTDSFGRGVGPVGEVTGDGLADVLVTEERIGADGDSHESLVLLPGRRSRATINPRRVTPPGGRLALPADTDLDWYGPLGDVNGDGLGDYAVQADLDDDPDQLMRTYVILGSRQGPPARLDALGAAGFVIR